MNLNAIVNEVLTELFKGYIEHGGTPIFDVTEIIKKHGENPHEIGKYLVDSGVVKNQQFRPTGFGASISMRGIESIKPDYLEDNLNTIISTLGETGTPSIMEILEFEPKDYQLAFDMAKYLEGKGLIEAHFRHNDVLIKLSLTGREYYENNNAYFFS